LAFRLLTDIQAHCSHQLITVVLTHNLAEDCSLPEKDYGFKVLRVTNRDPQGYGANHNQAFRTIAADYFCALNPDLRLEQDPFPALLTRLEKDPQIGAISPLVLSPDRQIEDNARRLPTPGHIVKRIIKLGPRREYDFGTKSQPVDWLAGMFLLFPSPIYRQLNGFDERYFLYCEDVDLGCRLRLAGLVSELDPTAAVIHEPRRSSHRRPRHLFWHLSSLVRFFRSPVYSACRSLKDRLEI
jgi:N-acetylglucosaminyl-diphospho-decaprenol L-rhamnosyltransferase